MSAPGAPRCGHAQAARLGRDTRWVSDIGAGSVSVASSPSHTDLAVLTAPDVRATPANPLRIGLVGAGRWGTNYLRALPETSGACLSAVCDPDPAVRAQVASLGVVVTAEIDELLPLVDAVVIAAPSALHARLSLRALDAGKHVLVEKPLATDVADAGEVIERAAAAARTLLVGHLTLCHPALIQLSEQLASGVIGDLKAIDVARTSVGARHRRDSALWALGPHDIANVWFVSRTSTARVRDAWAHGHDEAGIELELDRGVLARMAWSRCSASAGRRMVVHGSDGSLVFDELTGRLLLERAGSVTELAAGECVPSLLHRQCADFVRAILEHRTTEPNAALQVVRILAAAQSRLDRPSTEQKLSAVI